MKAALMTGWLCQGKVTPLGTWIRRTLILGCPLGYIGSKFPSHIFVEFANSSILTPWLSECPSSLFASNGNNSDDVRTIERETNKSLIRLFLKDVDVKLASGF